MKNILVRRSLTFLLALLMLTVSFVSCKKSNANEGVSSDATSDAADVTEPEKETFEYDENGYVKDRIPENINFKGQKVDMLHWKTNGEYVTETAKDAISSALYYRVLNTQERLNNFISIEYANGGWDQKNDFVTKVYNDVMSGNPHFEIVSHYSFAAPIGAMYGLYQNLNNVEYVDFEMPWWYSDVKDFSEIDGKVYFATGDIAANAMKMTICMFFNADLLDAHGYDVDEFYADVIAGKWTVEMMQTMIKNTYVDLSKDGTVSDGDFYGLSVPDSPAYDALFYGANMRIIDRNADGSYSLSRDWSGVKTQTLVEEYKEIIYSQDCIRADGHKSFNEGRSLLILSYFSYALGTLKDANYKYGVLPVPKYDEMQTNYGTCPAATISLYSVTYNCSNADMAGATLEALASDGYRNITPAIFEEGLKVKYSESHNDAAVYDIIRESVMFDIGRLWGDQIFTSWRHAFGTFRNAIEHQENWMSTVAMTQGPFIECLNNIVNTITAIDH